MKRIISALIAVIIWGVLAVPALADDPTYPGSCSGGYYTFHWSFDSGGDLWTGGTGDEFTFTASDDNTGNGGGALQVALNGTSEVEKWSVLHASDLLGILGGTGQILSDGVIFSAYGKLGWLNSNDLRLRINYTDTSYQLTPSQYLTPVYYYKFVSLTANNSKYIDNFKLYASNVSGSPRTHYMDDITIQIPCANVTIPDPPAEGELTCSLVPNADFIDTDYWLLGGTATITNNLLTLQDDDNAVQNINGLLDNTTYNAVFSTTNTSGSFTAVLENDQETVNITEPGLYTVTFTTGNVSGPLSYGFVSVSGTINIDYTCLSLAATGPSGPQNECIAPPNGDFELSANGWDMYRGAEWSNLGRNISLPTADNAILLSSSPFSLPTIAAGEYLLFSYSSYALGGDGLLGFSVVGDSLSYVGYYETYQGNYTYETDISDIAGENAIITFINAATNTLTADLTLDDVCIFITDRPPNIPQNSDPYALVPPVDFGFPINSCSDVDGIWAGLGVNMAQYRAVYQAGASATDIWGWIPWLAAAIFSVLGDWSCMFMASIALLVDKLEYMLNSILNVANWFVINAPGIMVWIRGLAQWLWENAKEYAELGRVFMDDGADWLWESLKGAATGVRDGIKQIMDWIWDTAKNDLKTIVNWLIDGWNLLVAFLGLLISAIIEDWVTVWNNVIYPILLAVWQFVSQTLSGSFINLTGFLLGAWELFAMLFAWLWANGFQLVSMPIEFYNAFDQGINSGAFTYLLGCDTQGFWCSVLAGLQLINQSASHTVMYPAVIVGIIIATISIFWRDLWRLVKIDIS